MSEKIPESSEAPQVAEVLPNKFCNLTGPKTSVVIDDEEPDPDEQAREDTFAASYQWEGKDLLEWSFTRETVFLSQRRSLGAPSIDEINKDLVSFLSDAARILWLCSTEPAIISALRSRPALMQEAIDEWAETAIPRGTRGEATDLALEIFNSGSTTQPTAVDDGTPPGN